MNNLKEPGSYDNELDFLQDARKDGKSNDWISANKKLYIKNYKEPSVVKDDNSMFFPRTGVIGTGLDLLTLLKRVPGGAVTAVKGEGFKKGMADPEGGLLTALGVKKYLTDKSPLPNIIDEIAVDVVEDPLTYVGLGAVSKIPKVGKAVPVISKFAKSQVSKIGSKVPEFVAKRSKAIADYIGSSFLNLPRTQLKDLGTKQLQRLDATNIDQGASNLLDILKSVGANKPITKTGMKKSVSRSMEPIKKEYENILKILPNDPRYSPVDLQSPLDDLLKTIKSGKVEGIPLGKEKQAIKILDDITEAQKPFLSVKAQERAGVPLKLVDPSLTTGTGTVFPKAIPLQDAHILKGKMAENLFPKGAANVSDDALNTLVREKWSLDIRDAIDKTLGSAPAGASYKEIGQKLSKLYDAQDILNQMIDKSAKSGLDLTNVISTKTLKDVAIPATRALGKSGVVGSTERATLRNLYE